jgi:hypothetical protein
MNFSLFLFLFELQTIKFIYSKTFNLLKRSEAQTNAKYQENPQAI